MTMLSKAKEELNGDGKLRSRLARILQPHEGGADIFGSERSFAPPIGERFDLEHVKPGGYYIDFRVKLEAPDWPPPWLEPRDGQLHVGTVQWALGAYERYLHGEGEEWLEAALTGARYLISIQEKDGAYDGAWQHWYPMPHTYLLEIPWASGITQGEGASLLARIYSETGDEQFADAALRAIRPLQTPRDMGGLLTDLDGPFLEEYPSSPPSFVLNGAIFALWGLRDVGHTLGDQAAASLFEEGLECLASNLHRYDTGAWSLYDLFPHPVKNLSSASYHLLHINQLTVLEQMGAPSEVRRVRDRFASYRLSARKRTNAFVDKVGFRVVVPRNATLAPLSPSMFRQRHRRVQDQAVVLCYHAVSDDWPSPLAVRPSDFRAQISGLLARGFEPVTFTELVCGEPDGKRLAITFDDGFKSVASRAGPILAELGAPATSFIPSALVPGAEPLHWNGIEQWLDTSSEPELEPMSLDDIRGLLAAGWEIGAHSRTHPHLRELGDEALAAELRGSREDCERLLDRPCLSLAYPYGDEDIRVQRATAEAGFAAAATLTGDWRTLSPHAWPRIGIYRVDSNRRFHLKVAYAMRALRRSPAWRLREGLRAPEHKPLRAGS
jgi:peptidoglycan/xylan/chitin deacetylase (PgdA/CDA1 family)